MSEHYMDQERGVRVRAIADGVAQWCLLVLVALLPIFVLPVSWILIGQAKILLLGSVVTVALIAWVVARFLDGSIAIPKNILLLSVSLLPVAYTASALLSGGSANSFVGGSAEQDTVVVVCMLYTFFVLIALVRANNPHSLTHLLRAFIFGGTALVIFQLLRLAFPEWLTLGGVLSGSASSIIGSWHDLGIIAGFIVFIASALESTPATSGLLWKWGLRISGVGALIILFVINAIDVWYTLAATALLFAAYRAYSAYVLDRLPLWQILMRVKVLIACVIIAVACATWGTTLIAYLPAQVQIAQLEVRPSWRGTFAVGEKVLSGKNGLIFGSGPNTFVHEWSRFKPVGVNATAFWNVNFAQGVGIIPTAFVTVGILGFIAWTLSSLGLLWSIVRLLRNRRFGAAPLRAYTAAILFAVLYLMSFLIMYVPGIGVVSITFLFLGMLVAVETAHNNTAFMCLPLQGYNWKHFVSALMLVVISLLLTFASITALRATLSDLYLARAASDFSVSNDIVRAGKLVGDALRIFPQNDNAQRAAVELGLAQFSQLLASGKTDEAARKELQATLSKTIQHGLAAVSINENDYLNWLALAGLYRNLAGVGVQGAFENAKSAYERAIAENPTNPIPLSNLAQLEIAQGDMAAALDDLNRAIALKQDFPAAYYFRSQIKASKNDFAGAMRDAQIVADLVPTDPLGWYNLGMVQYASGAYSESVVSLKQATSLQENYANAMYVLALAYEKLGRQTDAIALMEKVGVLNPDNVQVSQMILQLKRDTSTPQRLQPAR